MTDTNTPFRWIVAVVGLIMLLTGYAASIFVLELMGAVWVIMAGLSLFIRSSKV